MQENGGRTGDDRPIRPDELPSDDGRPTGVRRDDPRGVIRPVKERRTDDMSRYRNRIAASLREDDAALLQRYVPVKIYLHDGANAAAVERAVTRLLTAVHVSVEAAGEPEIGSWFKSLLGRTEERVTGRELEEALEVIRRVLAAATSGDGVDLTIAYVAAAAALLDSIKEETSVAIQIGSILVLKYADDTGQSRLVARTLTKDEMLYIEENPGSMKIPEMVIEELGRGRRDDVAIPVPDRRLDRSLTGPSTHDDK